MLIKQTAEIKEQVFCNTRLLQNMSCNQNRSEKDRTCRMPCQLPLTTYDAVLEMELKLKSKDFYTQLVSKGSWMLICLCAFTILSVSLVHVVLTVSFESVMLSVNRKANYFLCVAACRRLFLQFKLNYFKNILLRIENCVFLAFCELR